LGPPRTRLRGCSKQGNSISIQFRRPELRNFTELGWGNANMVPEEARKVSWLTEPERFTDLGTAVIGLQDIIYCSFNTDSG
jgi:hypothetical protein